MPAALDQPQFELNQAALYISHFAFLTKKKRKWKKPMELGWPSANTFETPRFSRAGGGWVQYGRKERGQ